MGTGKTYSTKYLLDSNNSSGVAGQVLSTTSTGIDVTGVITTDGLTTSADINFGDNDKAVFGTGGTDLQIYHDGSHSYVKDAGTGNLKIQGDNMQLLTSDGASTYLEGVASTGAVTLYHASNAPRIATTSTGVDVTGDITNSGRVGINTDSPLQRLHVFNASSGVSAASSNSDLIVENSANSGISILTPGFL